MTINVHIEWIVSAHSFCLFYSFINIVCRKFYLNFNWIWYRYKNGQTLTFSTDKQIGFSLYLYLSLFFILVELAKQKLWAKKMRFKKLKSTQSIWCSSLLQYRSGHLSSLFFFQQILDFRTKYIKQVRPCVMVFYLQSDWLFRDFCFSKEKEREPCRDSSQILFLFWQTVCSSVL